MPEIVWTPRVKDLTSQTSPNRSRSCCGQHSKYLGLLSLFKAIKAFQSENKSNVIPPSLKTLDGKITIIQISGVGLWQWRNRGYFMVGECGRFFFTSCERRERTSERSEQVSSATPRNEWRKIGQTNQPWSNLFILYVLRFQKNTTQKNRYEE